MGTSKAGRKPLGKNKREHQVMVRFNSDEFKKLKEIIASFDMDMDKRGVLGPFLRRWILRQNSKTGYGLPNKADRLAFQIGKVGNNINQLAAIAHRKNQRSPNSSLMHEVQQSKVLLQRIIHILEKDYL